MKTSSIAVCSWWKRLLNEDFSIYFQIDIFVFLRSQVCKFLSGQVKTGFAVDEKGFYSCTTSPPSRPWLHFPAISYTFSTIIILIILLIIHICNSNISTNDQLWCTCFQIFKIIFLIYSCTTSPRLHFPAINNCFQQQQHFKAFRLCNKYQRSQEKRKLAFIWVNVNQLWVSALFFCLSRLSALFCLLWNLVDIVKSGQNCEM